MVSNSYVTFIAEKNKRNLPENLKAKIGIKEPYANRN
jgi:hypothetical protein